MRSLPQQRERSGAVARSGRCVRGGACALPASAGESVHGEAWRKGGQKRRQSQAQPRTAEPAPPRQRAIVPPRTHSRRRGKARTGAFGADGGHRTRRNTHGAMRGRLWMICADVPTKARAVSLARLAARARHPRPTKALGGQCARSGAYSGTRRPPQLFGWDAGLVRGARKGAQHPPKRSERSERLRHCRSSAADVGWSGRAAAIVPRGRCVGSLPFFVSLHLSAVSRNIVQVLILVISTPVLLDGSLHCFKLSTLHK